MFHYFDFKSLLALAIQGVEKVIVDFATASAQFKASKQYSVEDVIKEINTIGFKANKQLVETDNTLQTLFSVCLIFTIPLFCHMFLHDNHILRNPLVQLGLCLPVFAIGCYHFGRSAWASLKLKKPNMDVLVMMGSSAAFFYSTAGILLFWQTEHLHTYLFLKRQPQLLHSCY